MCTYSDQKVLILFVLLIISKADAFAVSSRTTAVVFFKRIAVPATAPSWQRSATSSGASPRLTAQPAAKGLDDIDEADRIFDRVDVDGSGTVDLDELTSHLSQAGYDEGMIPTLFASMDLDGDGEISRDEFRQCLQKEPNTEQDADRIFDILDVDGSGTVDLGELTDHLLAAGYGVTEIQSLFHQMDSNQDGVISRAEFRHAILGEQDPAVCAEDSDCPRGYFLNSVKQTCEPLGPIGRVSQKIETLGPFKRAYTAISNLFGVDTKRIRKLGISFFISYSILSNINSAISLSVAWYISCKRTGLSPLVPGQWKSLLGAYGMIYGLVQLLKPFRVAGAIAMSKLSAEYLEMTQTKLDCSKGAAIGLQYMSGLVMMALCAFAGVSMASLAAGVALWG